MKRSEFSRRGFVAAGSVMAASVFIPGESAMATGLPVQEIHSMLNVMSFGAKGDGKTDDTAAVQKALDQAGLTHGAVFFPEGNYLCSELQVREGTGLHGLPAWSYRKGMGLSLIHI